MCIKKFSNLFKILQHVLNNKMDQEERIKKMKVKDLKEELKSLKKPVYGLKTVLVERLINYYTKEAVNNTQAICKYMTLFDLNLI